MSTEINSASAQALKKVKELVNETYAAKIKADEAEAYYKKLKTELLDLMETSEIDTFEADACKAYCKPKSSVTMPKDISQKLQVFDYIRANHGEEVLNTMLTINPKSFNSWFNAEAEAALAEGNLDFNLADIKPYEYFSVSFRKKATAKK